MAASVHLKTVKRLLHPAYPLIFVSKQKITKLGVNDISFETVGQKTFGLTTLPGAWTLPFFGISGELFQSCVSASKFQQKHVSQWLGLILDAAREVGIKPDDEVLIRSSGSGEGMAARGKFYTVTGTIRKLDVALNCCLKQLVSDNDLRKEHIPLLIQKRCVPEKAKGHLSNERRCYEENRDWLGEIESSESRPSLVFPINLRHWREKRSQQAPDKLACQFSARISEILKIPADWVYRKKTRVHFEWVWDGYTVYLVQADEEWEWVGHDPVNEHLSRDYLPVTFKPACLRRVTANDAAAARFAKVRNVSTYLKLKLPTAPLYILDDKKIIKQLSLGNVPSALEKEISEMVKGSLVIRTDLATEDMSAKQLLPRTHEVRECSEAFKWIVKQSKVLLAPGYDSAFIFHNFIPSQAAAFAYAAPNEPLVQIASLWGLPEGLYYNSHDIHVVDTVKAEAAKISLDDISNFPIRERRNFKRFFVSTTPIGRWETLSIKPPYDWKRSISENDCRKIAYESRRIAREEGQPVSIMWFVGVPESVSTSPAIPWYHEAFTLPEIGAARSKSPFDEYYVIRSAEDLKGLEKVTAKNTTMPRIRIQPTDEKFLREKSTLKIIGEHAKATGAIIVLEGTVLSHPYYQLINTGAIVEVVHAFTGFDEHHDYNKLVRDKVPDQIRQRGETITTATLTNDALIKALQEKLVEEAYELVDAKDVQSMIAELADVREVIDTLMERLNISDEDVTEEQAKKSEKRGGFSKGIVLLETESKPPTSKSNVENQKHFKGMESKTHDNKIIDEAQARRRIELLEKRTDRRVIDGKVEVKAAVSVPVTRGIPWAIETTEVRIEGSKGKLVTGRARGVRRGSQWNVEVSVQLNDAQPELSFDTKEKPR